MQDLSKKCSISSRGDSEEFQGRTPNSNFGIRGASLKFESVKSVAYSLGFDLVGVAPIGPFPETKFYAEWLERGYAGEMKYLERQKPAKLHPESLLPGARSVVVCAMN